MPPLTGIYKKCEYCGKEYYIQKNRIGKSRFCSYRCTGLNRVGSISHRRNGKILICKDCSKEFYVNLKRLGTAKYCSKECLLRNTLFTKEMVPWNKGFGDYMKGEKNHFFGRTHTAKAREIIGVKSLGRKRPPEVLEKMSIRMSGEGNPSWIGGLSRLPYPPEWGKRIKRIIRERDNNTCQLCGRTTIMKMNVHHIDYDKNNLDHSNLISLCHSCHLKTNFNRNNWITLFQKIIQKRICLKG